MERSLFLDCEDVTVSVKETIVEWVDALVSLDQLSKLILPNYAHTLRSLRGEFDRFGFSSALRRGCLNQDERQAGLALEEFGIVEGYDEQDIADPVWGYIHR